MTEERLWAKAMATLLGKLSVGQEVLVVLLLLPLLSRGFYIQPEVIRFSEHPRSLFALTNSSFSLSCSIVLALDVVEQLPLPQIVWDLDGEVAPGISTTNNLESILEIDSANSTHTGWYRCLVIDGNNPSLCQETLPCLTTITASQAAYVNVIDGSSVSRTVNVSSLCMTVVISCLDHAHGLMEVTFPVTWVRGAMPVNTSFTELLPSGDLVLKPSNEMLGMYQCYTMLPSLESSVLLSQVTVELNENDGEGSLTVQLQAFSTMVVVDTTLELVCIVEGSCDLSAITWSKDGQALELGSAMTGEEVEPVSMVIPSAKHHHGGQYCCSVENIPSCIDIIIIEPMVNSTTDHFITTVNQENATLLTLDCASWPYTNISPVWLHDGHVILTDAQQFVVNITGAPSNLIMGIYQCFMLGLPFPAVAVHRVLPLGWPNPPGNLSYIPREPIDIYAHVVLLWQPPTYTGGLNETSFNYTLFGEVEEIGFSFLEFPGNRTMESLLLHDFTFLFSVAINSSIGQLQVVSERSEWLTVSGDFCTLYSSQPPNVTLDCEQDGQSVLLEWKGLDMDLTYYYSHGGTEIEIGCYVINTENDTITLLPQFDSSTEKEGSIILDSLTEGNICSFVGVDSRCEDNIVTTVGSCTIPPQSHFLIHSNVMRTSVHTITPTTPHFIASTATFTTVNTTFVTSSAHSSALSTVIPGSFSVSITTTPSVSISASFVPSTSPSTFATSPTQSSVLSTVLPSTSPLITTTATPSIAMPADFVSSTSPLSIDSPVPVPTVVVVVSVVAGGLFLAFVISAFLLITNCQHQRSRSKKDNGPWLVDPYPPLPMLDDFEVDTSSIHTLYAQIGNQQELVDTDNLLDIVYPLGRHTSPTKVGPGMGVVTVLRDGEEEQSVHLLPLQPDSTVDAVYCMSSSRKTSTDTSASSLETDSGYIHCGTSTYASSGNGETLLDQRLEAIQEDLELCRLPCMAEEDAFSDEKELKISLSFQDVCPGAKDLPIIEPDSTSENSTNLNDSLTNIVIPETPV